MSHFVTIILIPVSDEIESAEDFIQNALAPYDEGLEVEPYQKTCYCVGKIAERDAEARAPLQEVRDRFATENPVDGNEWELPDEENARRNRLWRSEAYLKGWEARIADLAAQHPQFEKPDQECTECRGLGIATSRYNPKSQWDWWSIGGRWSGWINDQGGREDTDTNSCIVSELLSQEKLKVPFAIITPDGKWYQKGDMLWFGTVANEEDQDAWEKTVRSIYETHPTCLAVALDLHI